MKVPVHRKSYPASAGHVAAIPGEVGGSRPAGGGALRHLGKPMGALRHLRADEPSNGRKGMLRHLKPDSTDVKPISGGSGSGDWSKNAWGQHVMHSGDMKATIHEADGKFVVNIHNAKAGTWHISNQKHDTLDEAKKAVTEYFKKPQSDADITSRAHAAHDSGFQAVRDAIQAGRGKKKKEVDEPEQ